MLGHHGDAKRAHGALQAPPPGESRALLHVHVLPRSAMIAQRFFLLLRSKIDSANDTVVSEFLNNVECRLALKSRTDSAKPKEQTSV